MKRTLKKLLAYLFMYLVLTSCNEFLTREPLSDLSPGTFFLTTTDMNVWKAGIYDAFQATLSGNHLEWGDFRSDIYHKTGYGDYKAYMNALESSQGEYSWANLYKTIYRCNVAIERFPKIPGLTIADWGDNLGQAYGMRALMYFFAIRVWGDVPLVIESWDGDVKNSYVGRTPISEIKKQIMSDISESLRYLNTDVGVGKKYYINMAATYALKMDVHMWFKEYQQALDTYNQYFQGNTNFELVKNAEEWKNIFLSPTSSKESIFNMHWNFSNDGAHPWARAVGARDINPNLKLSQKVFNIWVDRLRSKQGSDGRFWNTMDTLKMFFSPIGSQMPISYAIWTPTASPLWDLNHKYAGLDPATNSTWLTLSRYDAEIFISIYRFADPYLLKAEALNQLGYGTQALQLVNSIRARVGYRANALDEVLDHSNKIAIQEIILKERMLEFIAEGKRWFDLVRTGTVIEVMDPVMRERQIDANMEPKGFDDPRRILFPIFYREFESNPALRGNQNPPYTEG